MPEPIYDVKTLQRQLRASQFAIPLTKMEVLTGTARLLRKVADEIEKQSEPGARFIDWLHEGIASPGIPVKPDSVLLVDPYCKSFDIGKGKHMVFKKGIIGALRPDQQEKYCRVMVPETSPPLKARVERFRQASDICVEEVVEKCAPTDSECRLLTRIRCMGRELRQRGIEV
ncbi:MAG: hypothetical protein ACE5IJ_12075 [Thermoplasmata archaeon]